MVFISKNDMDNVIKISNKEAKMEKCNQISRFYIKIANIFAAIVSTINPEYIHTDSFGKITKYTLNDKHKIPQTGHVEISKTNNICGDRIDILVNDLFLNLNSPNKKTNINPNPQNLCFFNKENQKTFDKQIGIPELLDLYYDDAYDYKTGKFTGMTLHTKKQFQKDLNKFYTEYTGNIVVPEHIQKFSDIPLHDYSKKKYCQQNLFANTSTSTEISHNDQLFQEYAKNLKKMIQTVNDKHNEMISILNKMFVYIGVNNDGNVEKIIRINPELNEDSLQNIVIETRDCINDLHLNCEKDFLEGIQIYEAIVETRIFETTKNQIESLEKITEKLMF